MDKRKYLKALLRGVQYKIHKCMEYDVRGGKITAQIQKEMYEQAKARGIDAKEPKPIPIKGDDVALMNEHDIDSDEDLCIYLVATSEDVERAKKHYEEYRKGQGA